MRDIFYKGCALFTGLVLLLTTVPSALAHTYAGAPAYHHWVVGEQLLSSDLNNTFDHIHNTFSGNIADAHISATAAIQHSKMQFPQVLPKAVAYVAPDCTTNPCTMAFNTRISNIARGGGGNYIVTLGYMAHDNVYGIVTTPATAGNAIACVSTAISLTTYGVVCYDAAKVATDTGFITTVFDNDN